MLNAALDAIVVAAAVFLYACHVQLITWSNICKNNRVYNHCHFSSLFCLSLLTFPTHCFHHKHTHASKPPTKNSLFLSSHQKIYSIWNEANIPFIFQWNEEKHRRQRKNVGRRCCKYWRILGVQYSLNNASINGISYQPIDIRRMKIIRRTEAKAKAKRV